MSKYLRNKKQVHTRADVLKNAKRICNICRKPNKEHAESKDIAM